jgi:hypothetical protein
MTSAKVLDFTACPPRIFLELAELSRGNDRVRRVWLRRYLSFTV